MTPLLSHDDARSLIVAAMPRFPVEAVHLEAASQRILRQDIVAERALPPYDRVTMDGIAIRYDATVRRFRVRSIQAAGEPPATLSDPSSCIEIMTGAVMPVGADTVVPTEQVIQHPASKDKKTTEQWVTLREGYDPVPGQHRHRQGADCAAGALLASAGIRLTPPVLAIAAANGVATPQVAVIPSLAIVSTGNELVAPEDQVLDWQIRRSNEFAITGSLHRQGLIRHTRHSLPDDRDRIEAELATCLERHDALILSGGVSMGRFDHVPAALAALGVQCIFHKVAQRPGKPLWFGMAPGDKPVFALPGNPVSAQACCSIYVVPALLAAQGLTAPACWPVALSAAVAPLQDMTRLVPARLLRDECGVVSTQPCPMPTSGDFNMLAGTDGVIVVPAGQTSLPAGTVLPFYDW